MSGAVNRNDGERPAATRAVHDVGKSAYSRVGKSQRRRRGLRDGRATRSAAAAGIDFCAPRPSSLPEHLSTPAARRRLIRLRPSRSHSRRPPGNRPDRRAPSRARRAPRTRHPHRYLPCLPARPARSRRLEVLRARKGRKLAVVGRAWQAVCDRPDRPGTVLRRAGLAPRPCCPAERRPIPNRKLQRSQATRLVAARRSGPLQVPSGDDPARGTAPAL